MEAGPWSGLPVADPSPWGRWEGRACLGPGIAGSGLQDCLKKGVEEVRAQGPGEGSWELQAAPLLWFQHRRLGGGYVSRYYPTGVDTSGALAHIFQGPCCLLFPSTPAPPPVGLGIQIPKGSEER